MNDPLVGADKDTEAQVHPTAIVDDTAVLGKGVVVGDRAQIAPDTHLARTVVFPGATVKGQVANAVVMPDGSVLRVG